MKYWLYTVFLVLLIYSAATYQQTQNNTLQKSKICLSCPEPLYEQFTEEVVPVLEKRCSVCHGVETGEYRKFKGSYEFKTLLKWEVNAGGRMENSGQRRLAYDLCAKAGDRDLQPIDRSNGPMASMLVRAPLASVYSGSNHPEIFSSPDDPDFKVLLKWVRAEIEDNPAAPKPLESEAERFFAENVTPVLMRKTCMGLNCHGPMAFNDLKLDPGIPTFEGRFTPDLYRKNRRAMLGNVTRLVSLGGDVEQSKQLLKNIPVGQGGIIHKGGNQFFRKGDPDYRTLVRWLELEAEVVWQRVDDDPGRYRGIIFVRRPKSTPERFFEDGNFLSGGDLIWRRDGKETNLTASLHPKGPADIRAPDVRYDANAVVFAMRRSANEPFNIWEIDLESGAARQLTFSEDTISYFMDPLYVPDPDDTSGDNLARVSLVMVSNLEGEWCASSPDGILGEAEEGTTTTIIDHRRTEKPGTFKGRKVWIVRGTNAGEERIIVRHDKGLLEVNRPFPSPCDSTTHYVIASNPGMAPKYDLYRMRLAKPGREKEIFNKTLKRMTWSVSQIRRPTMRSSGEIVFTTLRTGWQEQRPYFNGALYRIHADGSNYHVHNGNRSGVPIISDDREMANGLEIRIGRDAGSRWGGTLILSDHQFGPTIEPDNPTDNLDHPYREGRPETSAFRFVPGWISLDPKSKYGGVSPGGTYRDPYPLPDGSVMVSYAEGPVDMADPDAAPDFDIVRLIPDPSFQSDDGFKAGKFRREMLVSGPDSELCPRPVVSRLKEPVTKTLKYEKDLFGPPQVVRGFQGYPEGTPAVLQIYDLALLDAFFEQVTPVGPRHLVFQVCPDCPREAASMDQLEYVRIIGAEPQHAGETGLPRRFIIAEAPLKEDGSVYLQIPSGVSFDIQSLNPLRMALRSPNRWLYAHPGEKHALSIPRTLFAQTCGGCHGGFTGDSRDILRRPDAITSASRTLANWEKEKHAKRVPYNYSEDGKIKTLSVDFEKDILPVLIKKCITCHSGGERFTGPDLSGEEAFESLRPYVEYKEALAIKSYLIEKLLGKELSAPRKLSGDTPHPSANPLTGEEFLQFVRWIDLGAK